MFDVPFQTSDDRCPISDVSCQKSGVRYHSDVQCLRLISDVRLFMSDVQFLTCPMFDVPFQTSDDRCPISDVSCQKSGVRYHSDVQCLRLISDVRLFMSDVQFLTSDVRCLMFNVQCLMTDV